MANLGQTDGVHNNQEHPDHLRNKVVQIISGTANGCLKELGYQPDFKTKMQQAEQVIDNLRMDNSRLYIDNRTMRSHLALQNDRISFHESSADDQWKRTVDLREKNHFLRQHNAELKAKYEAHVAGLPNERAYATLLSELEKFQGLYRQAIAENTTLRFEVQRLTDQCTKHGLYTKPHVGGSQGPSSAAVEASDGRLQNGAASQQYHRRPGSSSAYSLSPAQFTATNYPPMFSENSVWSPETATSSGPPTRSSSTNPSRQQIIDLTEDHKTAPRKRARVESEENQLGTRSISCATSSIPHPASPPQKKVPNPPTSEDATALSGQVQPVLETGGASPAPSVGGQLPLSASYPTIIQQTADQSATVADVEMDSEEQRAHLEQCLEEVMESQADGSRICRLCVYRHEVKAMSQPPKRWADEPLEELVAHCQENHPIAWKGLLDAEEEDEEEEEENSSITIPACGNS